MNHHQSSISTSRGFTLIELIFTISLSAIILTVIIGIFTNLFSLRGRINDDILVQNVSDQILLGLTSEVRWATTITNTTSSITIVTGTETIVYSYNSSAQILTKTRNGTAEQIIPTHFKVANFKVENKSSDPTNKPSYAIILDLSYQPRSSRLATKIYKNQTAATQRNRFST